MARIAVVDLVFHWPPQGGSMVHLQQVLKRLSHYHEIRLFVLDAPYVYPRGRIERSPGFPIEPIPVSRRHLNALFLPAYIRSRVDAWKPDLVWIADGWTLKPYVLTALEHHRPWHRFFAYEMLCPAGNQRFYLGKRCPRTVLTDPSSCRAHVALMLGYWAATGRLAPIASEALLSLAFMPVYARTVRRALQASRMHIVSSPHYYSALQEYAATVRVVPGGVDTAHFSPRKQEGNGILMVGRCDDNSKGLSVLVDAVVSLRKKGIDVSLRYTGKGKQYAGATPVPWTDYQQLPDVYKSAQIVVVPSLWEEGFGKVALEAMSCGVPVVASCLGGLTSIVQDGISGFLFSPGDSLDLAEKIERLLKDSDLRHSFSSCGIDLAREQFDWDVIVDKYYLPAIEKESGV